MDELRRIRKERGLSQQRLAEMANVDKVTIVHIEGGKVSPKVETLEKLATALGVEMADLFPKAQAPLPLEELPSRAVQQGGSWREAAEEFINEHEPLLRDEALTEVVSGKLAQRSATRMTEVRHKFNEANASEDFPLTELNDLTRALERLIAFTKAVIENHEQRFGAPYDPVEEAESYVREAEKNHGSLS